MNTEATVQIPAIELPPSAYVSPEAQKSFTKERNLEPRTGYSKENIQAVRKSLGAGIDSALTQARALFPTNIVETEMDGVPVSIITPKDGIPQGNSKRVLIELHPGAFIMGAGYGVVESIPLAALGQIKVVSVDYRLAPENQYPAATEDVLKVYRTLLQEYKPESIGICGSSAGGLLVAQALAWFQRHGLPRPGAIAILGAGADARFDGDSRYTNPASGFAPPPEHDLVEFMLKSYFGDADIKDPMISPVWSREILAKFPPSLIITSTRAHECSGSIFTHRELVKAGVAADLHVWDGLPHVFHLFDVGIPESRDLYDVMVRFFARHLSPG